MGEVCQINGRIGFRGYTEKDIIPKEQGGVLAFTPTNIVNNQLTLNVRNTYITRVKYDESPEIMVKNGNILFVKTGSTLGKSALVTGFTEDSTVNPQVVVIKTDIPNQKILSTILTTDKVQSQVASVKIGGAVPTMTETELKNIELSMPINEDERIKIGAFFSKLDNIITLHQRKYFSFDFNGESAKTAQNTISWEQRKLSDMVERVTRKNENLESELPLTISAQYGLIDQNEFFDKRIASRDVSGYYLLKKGEFAYNKSTSSDAPWGAVKRLDRYEMGVLSTLYIVFALKEDGNIDSDFLVSYYDTDCWHKGVQAIAAEGARNHGLLNITPADYFETVLTVPSDVKEQHQIGSFFAKLDSLITLHQHKPNKKDTTL